MKILHCADLHLDTPFTGRTPEQTVFLQQQLLRIPGMLSELCRREGCDLWLLSGDVFDGPWTKESFLALKEALKDAGVPVFIAPGNHDYVNQNPPYLSEIWPENVHIFTQPRMETILLEELDCRVYGAGYRSMDCGSLLEGFQAREDARYHVGILHGDPTQANSPCCPVTAEQIRSSGLDYLALGHIHKQGFLQQGRTLCAWPGSPMGRGFDETGVKGVLLVTLEESRAEFIPLDTPRFFEQTCDAAALDRLLPAVGNAHFYRITLTGQNPEPSLETLYRQYDRFPNLELRDRRTAPMDLWSSMDADTLEGAYFRILREKMKDADDQTQEIVELAARISRQLLDGQEVVLP